LKAADVQKIISEVVQGLLGLGALAGIIVFQLAHQPIPDLLYLILGASLLAFGIKIGVPLSAPAATPAVQEPAATPAAPVSGAKA